VERFIALIMVTGCEDLLGVIADKFGKVVIERKYEALINIHPAEEAERRIAKFKQAEVADGGKVRATILGWLAKSSALTAHHIRGYINQFAILFAERFVQSRN